MKRFFPIIGIVTLLGTIHLHAQSAYKDIQANPNKSGNSYYAYPTPQKSLTPAPKRKKAFYISHYGRHGSRFISKGEKEIYARPLELLQEASKKHFLTPQGEKLLHRVQQLCNESLNRYGDLTTLGAKQHHEIARRMFQNYPEVFKGEVCVDAKSTTVIRCILSMENELQELLVHNPKLKITHDASEYDLYYMKYTDPILVAERYTDTLNHYLDRWTAENIHPERFIQSIFSDPLWAEENVYSNFFKDIFILAGDVQNTESRHSFNLYEFFTQEELYTLWQRNNMDWFIQTGNCSLNGARQSFSQRYLLKNIILTADSCLKLEKPGATLRFGHDTRVLPLVCLLNLNGYGETLHPSQLIEKEWYDYRIVPMACNVQFIFYRSNPNDQDVWVKILLNEEEASLPIPAVSGPYYRWNDLRKYCLDKVNTSEKSVKGNN